MVYDFKSGKSTQVADTPPVTTQSTTGVNPNLQKLMKIDSTIKKSTSPDQAINRFTDTNLNKKFVWIFFSDGNWRQRANSVNNKVDEAIGKWYFTDNEKNYQIKSETNGDSFDFKTLKWVQPNSPSKTWKEVTFTLEDVAAGKAVLKRGDKGPAVEELQKLMIQMNLSKVSKSGQPDGKFGKLTELAIKQFQGEMRYGEQDGKVGERTLKRMYRVYNYDPDLEVDDEQTQVPTGDDSPEFLQSQLDAQNATKVNSTTSSQPATQTATAQPATQAQPETPVQTKKKPNITPDALNEGDIRKIVSKNLKSLVK
jgi:peptidoglycan hydrolase-like protein with peptidoglycan-binding domain